MPFQPGYEVPEPRRAYTIVADNEATEGNGRVGCLMLHGFMGSPVSSHDMAKFLAKHGITVHCPLLPGHGNLPHKLYKVSRKAWMAEAEEALDKIRNLADQIFVMGHSMGAVLSAYLASKNNDIRGMVLIAPLYDVPDPRIKLALVARYFMPWFYPLKRKSVDKELFLGRVKDFNPKIDVHDPSLKDWLMEATRIPMSGTAQLVRMAQAGRRLWPKIKIPTIILQGDSDPAVAPGSAKAIFDTIQTEDKQLEMFPNTGHELMRIWDPAHNKVWQKIQQFISRQACKSQKIY